MKKTIAFIIVVCALLGSSEMKAQETVQTFRVIANGNATDINKYIEAVKAADMESYRYRTFSDTLVFDSGVKIEFYSAQQLFVMGKKIVVDNYSDQRPRLYTNPVFHLTDQGTLVALYQPVLTK